MKTLPQINGAAGFDGDDVMTAAGMQRIMKSHEFLFTLVFIKDLLETIEPVTKMLQTRAIGYKTALPLVRSVNEQIEKMRTQQNFDMYFAKTTDLLRKVQPEPEPGTDSDAIPMPLPRRIRRRSLRLSDSIVECTLGQRSATQTILKSTYFETIDIVLVEMRNRFVKENAILTAIDTADEMSLSALQPLAELGIELPTQIELQIASDYIKLQREANKDKDTVILAELFKVRAGMPTVYNLFAAIETFPSGTAICESSFSALTRMMRPQRQSMTSTRLNNLTFLSFEGKRLSSLNMDAIMKNFNSLKDRKVQLF